MTIRTPTYFIPVGDVLGSDADDLFLMYNPGALTAAVVDGAERLRLGPGAYATADLPEWHSPEDLTGLYVILNYKCNLSCSYCYSAAGRSEDEISPETLSAALKSFLVPAKRGRRLHVNFIGGGEPMMSRDILRQAVVEIGALADERELDVRVGVITNGSLISDDDIDFFVRHRVDLKISSDILPDVQATQRGAAEAVLRNIVRASARLPVTVRSVITPDNVCRQVEMVDSAAKNFPAVRRLKFDAVVSPEIFPDATSVERFCSAYSREFLRAMESAAGHGIRLDNAVVRMLSRPADRFCPPSLTVTPGGAVTSCVCFSSPRESGFESSVFGGVGEDSFRWKEPELSRHLSGDALRGAECGNCFLRYNCAGGCLARNRCYPDPVRKAFCEGRRDLARRHLLKRVDNALRLAGGRSLETLIRKESAPHGVE